MEVIERTEKLSSCPKCGSSLIIDTQTKELTCPECGLVVSRGLFMEWKEWRASSTEEWMERARGGAPTTPTRPSFGSETRIRISHKQTEMVRQLRRAKQVSKPEEERRLERVLYRLNSLAGELNIPSYAKERAAWLLRLAVREGITKGRRSEDVVAACVHSACRETGVPIPFKEIVEKGGANEKSMFSTFGKINEIIQKMGGRNPPHTPEDYIPRLCEELGIPGVATEAIKTYREVREELMGKNPLVIAGSVTYIAARRKNLYVTFAEIARVLDVTSLAVRMNAKKIMKYLKTENQSFS